MSVGLFRRRRRTTSETGDATTEHTGPSGRSPDDDVELPLRPQIRPLRGAARTEIDAQLSSLAGEGIDVADLDAVSRLVDETLAAWEALPAKQRVDHGPLVQRLSVAVGEYLVRHTDLDWVEVTDAFGTAPAIGTVADDFVVVPRDLVGVRWLNRSSGWVPGVLGHLVWVRADRTGATPP